MIRERVIKCWICYCFFVFITTEILSRFNLISTEVICWLYVISGLGLLVYLCVLFAKRKHTKFILTLPNYFGWYLVLFTVVLFPLLLIALYYPPNNWDSMTYHLPRVEHWIQNNNVEFYKTYNSRQLFMPPLAEYIILHWRLLSKTDVLSNFVQYFSMIFCLIVSTLIVKKLGGSKLGELLSAFLVATIPIGIMQSTSTQNDYVTCFFFLSFLYFFFSKNQLFFSLSIALGILTKSTFIIFSIPFLILILLESGKTKFINFKLVRIIFFFIVIVNISHWYRNYSYFGSMMGPRDMTVAMSNQSMQLKYILSNVVKNVGTQLGLPSAKYNDQITKIVMRFHHFIGLNLNDPKNTWFGTAYTTQFSIHEDQAGNTFLLILFGIVLVYLVQKGNIYGKYFWCCIAGFVIFSILFKWQPWHSRLELPLIACSCVFAGLIIDSVISKKIFIYLLIIFCIFMAIPFIFGNRLLLDKDAIALESNRPLHLSIFMNRKSRHELFLEYSPINRFYNDIAAVNKKLHISKIGLAINSDSWEYPLWYVNQYYGEDIKVSYVDGNASIFDEVIYDDIERNPRVTIKGSEKIYDMNSIKTLLK